MENNFDPANALQDIQNFGEFGGVNPSITDSSTYTFLKADRMEEIFEHEMEGCYLYSRHWNPINKYLSNALAGMESTESAHVTASGMGAISSVVMQLCQSGDEIVSSRTIYGGTYAFLKNFLPRYGIKTKFVDITDPEAVKKAMTDNTKIIYCETISNPLLEIADIPDLSEIAKAGKAKLVVDNTFTPLIMSPKRLGADVVVHSLTKFINGTSDCVAGAICGDKEFIDALSDVNSGAAMLLGPTLDSFRSASILKNLRSLHLRMKQHSHNAMFLASELKDIGVNVRYPGFKDHIGHDLLTRMMHGQYGYSGMMLVDVGSKAKAYELMEMMQHENVGYLAVSLGFYKTLFSAPGSSTSSEIPEEEKASMGLSDGLIRFSVGLDNDIQRTFDRIKKCMKETGTLKELTE